MGKQNKNPTGWRTLVLEPSAVGPLFNKGEEVSSVRGGALSGGSEKNDLGDEYVGARVLRVVRGGRVQFRKRFGVLKKGP